LLLSLTTSPAFSADLLQLIKKEEARTSSLSISLLVEKEGHQLYAYKEKESFIPASIQKIFTTKSLLNELGEDFVFKTNLYFDLKEKALIIDPSADPTITSESLVAVLRALQSAGISQIKKIKVLTTKEDSSTEAASIRAYAAGMAPFSFNYNAIGFTICPGELHQAALISPTSSLPLSKIINKTKTLVSSQLANIEVDPSSDNRWVVQGTMPLSNKCFAVYRSAKDPYWYFLYELKTLGKAFNINFELNEVSFSDLQLLDKHLLYSIESKPLGELIYIMNQGSSNFFANQFILALAKKNTNTFSFEKGLAVVRKAITDKNTVIADGSGLSRKNKSSAKEFLLVYKDLKSNNFTKAIFENSLPLYGKTGTLQDRSFALGSCVVRAKTGTLDGVSSLLGTVYTSEKDRQGKDFVLMQNGTSSIPEGREFEDRVLKELCTYG